MLDAIGGISGVDIHDVIRFARMFLISQSRAFHGVLLDGDVGEIAEDFLFVRLRLRAPTFRDDQPVDLVGPFVQPGDACVAIRALGRILFGVPVAAVNLQRLIDDVGERLAQTIASPT